MRILFKYIPILLSLIFLSCDYTDQIAAEFDKSSSDISSGSGKLPPGGFLDTYDWELPEKILNLYNTLDGYSYSDRSMIVIISAFVNRNIRFEYDSSTWGYDDFYQLPEITWEKKTGDCEDYAILTLYLLYRYTGIKGELIHLDSADPSAPDHMICTITINNKQYYIDYWNVYTSFNELEKQGYTVKKYISFGEALWIADEQYEAYNKSASRIAL